ncbi:MAG: hypothetical protein KGL53_01000 [Elusimicrobia bacterium]|nr:hypothetical protein [Elusimicrobiota bacterium]
MLAALAVAALAVVPARAQDQVSPGVDPAAAAAFAREHPDLGRLFTRNWRHLLDVVPELAAQRRFLLSQRRVELVFSDPGPAISADSVAMYSPGVVRINRQWLCWAGSQLAARGVPYSRIPGLLAWKLLPTLAHELRHGITHEQMREEVGDVCPAFVIENEVVSFYDNVRVGKAVLRRNPSAFTDDLLLGSVDRDLAQTLAAYKSGPTGLESLVASLYQGRLSAVSATRQQLLDEAEKGRSDTASLLSQYEAGDAAVKAQFGASYGQDPVKALDRSLSVYEGCTRVLSDPEKFRRFRNFYKDRIEAIEEDWSP